MTRPITIITGSEHPQDQSPQDAPRRTGQAEEQQQQSQSAGRGALGDAARAMRPSRTDEGGTA